MFAIGNFSVTVVVASIRIFLTKVLKSSKETYPSELSNRLNNSSTSVKLYWSILETFC